MRDVGNSLDAASSEAHAATAALGEAVSATVESNATLLTTHAQAIGEIERQSVETRQLLERTRQLLTEVENRVNTLNAIDVEGLKEGVRSLGETAANNADALNGRLTMPYAMVGVCIVVCLITLARLLMA